MIELNKLWRSEIIEFYCHPNLEGVIPEPRPARKDLAEWFKDLSPVCGDEDSRDSLGNRIMSAKKCLPMLDGMSLGYTIPLAVDVHIRSNYNNSQILVNNPQGGIYGCEFHNSIQVGGPNAIKKNHGNPLKFINHWIIKTAPGWSTLFVPPLNHLNSVFTCLSALVDTDRYPKMVNFPAVLNETDIDVHLPAGTPLVTAIPINRKVFDGKKPYIRKMTAKEFKAIDTMHSIQTNRTHYYTYELRVKK